MRVAAIGDSLTKSWPDQPGWVRQATDRLGLELVCEAAEPRQRAEIVRSEYLPRAIGSNPDVCVVLAGSNDVALGRVPIIELIRIWHTLNRAGIRVVAATLPPHEVAWRAGTAQFLTNVLIRLAAETGRVSLVELNRPLGGHRWDSVYRQDHGHPNAAGKSRMAELLQAVLERELDIDIRTGH